MNGISERSPNTAQGVVAAEHGAKYALRPSKTAIRAKRNAPRRHGIQTIAEALERSFGQG